MSEVRLKKQVGKAIIIHPPTMRALILRLSAKERQARSTPEKAYDEWHVVGGSLESVDGKSTKSAAVRETSEETGLKVRVVRKLGDAAWSAFYEGRPADFTADFYLCIATEDQPELPEVAIDEKESSEFAWVTEEELTLYQGRGLTPEADQFIREGLRQVSEIDNV